MNLFQAQRILLLILAIWPWYGRLALGRQYGKKAGKFLNVSEYTHIIRWATEIEARAAVKRGEMVNRTSGDLSGQLRERHSKQDFQLNTEDKITKVLTLLNTIKPKYSEHF